MACQRCFVRSPRSRACYGPWQLPATKEFRESFRSLGWCFRITIGRLGLESFTSPAQQLLASLPEADRDAWLDVVDATASLPEALGYADHFLYVGRRR